MRPLERRVHDVLIASTIIVVSAVVVTTHVRPEAARPVAAGVAPRDAIRIPPPPIEPPVPCPALRAARGYNDHTWIDPWGRRNGLACRGDVAITRHAGDDGELGTADDVCRQRAATCTLVAAERPDAT